MTVSPTDHADLLALAERNARFAEESRKFWFDAANVENKRAEKAEAERDQLKALLDERDNFIVGQGLWQAFMDALTSHGNAGERGKVIHEHYFVHPEANLSPEELAREQARFDEAAKKSTPMDLATFDQQLRVSTAPAQAGGATPELRERLAEWYVEHAEDGMPPYEAADAILALLRKSPGTEQGKRT